jgi:hypothetical protein
MSEKREITNIENEELEVDYEVSCSDHDPNETFSLVEMFVRDVLVRITFGSMTLDIERERERQTAREVYSNIDTYAREEINNKY